MFRLVQRSSNTKPLCYFSTIATFHTHFSTLEENLCSKFLTSCAQTSNLLDGKAIHAKFIKGSIPHSLYLQNHILNMYMKCGDLFNGHKLFDEMPQRNVVSWSAMVSGFTQHGFFNQALSLFVYMLKDGTSKPNEFTFVGVLQACSLHENLALAYQVYAVVLRLGFGSNVFLVNAFLTALMRHGKREEALEVFEKCLNKDIVTWNVMLNGYLESSCLGLPKFWVQMNNGVKPDCFSFASVLTGLASFGDLNMGLQVHGQLVKSGHGSEICVGNSLVDMYLKNQRLFDGLKAFNEMGEKDVCSWTQMAAGWLEYGEPAKALEVIGEMRMMSVKPNKFTLATFFNACANLALLEEGKKAHGLRIKLGVEIDVCVDNALIDMYAKCGSMDGAWGVFKAMDDRSIVSWTTMIMGCAQNGQAREALKIFDEMIVKGIKPNYITFVCVLYACSQGMFTDEAWKYFSSMTVDHGISPGEDHYVYMVHILGRAGHIKEAEELILSMPFQPGAPVWQTLLSACQIQGDIETGKRAAEHAINLDRKDPSSYVLLSNMFAGFNNWDDVGKLRELMETRDVKKVPGSSWIKIEKDCLVPPAP
ncbi:pentatricopeptide repeat-containing protein At2g13600-like [Durio zibethinus]|uniref:Pentatricopeptide repeat-containing protein At2g13600-like n=1 Tax=Durio zibethinus TaxID=66656 RepID=A0A6P5XX51_DURZI|nr:pentatricopeptide repeat-containing protein At2g13600-like [Durio zibethinus]